jgi:hypothetical protein
MTEVSKKALFYTFCFAAVLNNVAISWYIALEFDKY